MSMLGNRIEKMPAEFAGAGLTTQLCLECGHTYEAIRTDLMCCVPCWAGYQEER